MFEKSLEEVREEVRYFWGCRAGMGRVAVTPDGSLYPCSRFVGLNDEKGIYQIGHIEEGFYKSDLPKALQAGDWARFKCRRCPLAELCAGGCPAVNLVATGSLYEPPKSYCVEMKAWANTVAKLPKTFLAKGMAKTCPVEG